jgi:hypothetical protein
MPTLWPTRQPRTPESHGVNAPDELMARNTRIGDVRETSLDCRGVRAANTARLDANTHLAMARILKRLPHFGELSWFPYFNGCVGFTHFRCSLFESGSRGYLAAAHSKNSQCA